MTRLLALILATLMPTHSHTHGIVTPRHERAKGVRRHHRHKRRTWYSAVASVYSQWSGQVACGFRAPGGMGVAHKTLPCGTRVLFRYGGRRASAMVIDRGPFVAGREWDLSYEVQRALGFPYGVASLEYAL